MLKYYTAGESHGPGLIVMIEGMPAGVNINEGKINEDLARRQKGYGRGGRMKIETDRVEIISGVRNCVTLGSPISMIIRNRDYANWQNIMAPGTCDQVELKTIQKPLPGHADLAGGMKYGHGDLRNILERASARETAARTAAGAFFKQLLAQFNIYIYSEVISIGKEGYPGCLPGESLNMEETMRRIEDSPVRCHDRHIEKVMIEEIQKAAAAGETLGGCFTVCALGVPPGLGSHVSWERKLDSRIAGLLMSIPAIKAVEIGDGIQAAGDPGSKVHDPIYYQEKSGIHRRSNRSGGIEGGISNGETVWARAYMKPIPTLMHPLDSVNLSSWKEEKADVERSDVCAVPAAAVVGEAMLAYALAAVFLEKFSGDSTAEIETALSSYRTYLEKVWKWQKISY